MSFFLIKDKNSITREIPIIQADGGKSVYSYAQDGGLNPSQISEADLKQRLVGLGNPYQVGAIYLSTVEISPGQQFGGTWARIEDVFLVGAGDTYPLGQGPGSTGYIGEAQVKLTTETMPSHTHYVTYGASTSSTGASYQRKRGGTARTQYTDSKGSDGAHNNMPPYLTIYAWQRTA